MTYVEIVEPLRLYHGVSCSTGEVIPSQHQRSDLVDDLALFEGRFIAEVRDAGTGAGMTVVFELAHNQ